MDVKCSKCEKKFRQSVPLWWTWSATPRSIRNQTLRLEIHKAFEKVINKVNKGRKVVISYGHYVMKDLAHLFDRISYTAVLHDLT